MSALPAGLKLAWYGDDFTGATDTLATASQAGLRSLLFLGLPSPAQLARCGPLDCLGIAGAARAMTPARMQAELLPVGRLFAELAVPVLHYKICSTFDSAVQTGSIGAAIRALRPSVSNAFVPIIGGQPNLGRFCVFGNLFAQAGSNGPVHRLDRHPTMRVHPVTPMREADLRRHLATQGLTPMAALDYPVYEDAPDALDARLDALLTEKPAGVLMDVARASDLPVIGRLIWQRASQQRLLAVGASSVVQALAAHWHRQTELRPTADTGAVAPARGPVLVLAGSLSPQTARQARCATSYSHVHLDPLRLAAADGHYRQQLSVQVAALLRQGQSVLACTSDDASVAVPGTVLDARALTSACGRWLAQVLQAAPVRRLVIAGGDTSSHAVQALDAWGLSYLQSVSPGVALCRLHSEAPHLDGMELSLKGGQMGAPELFEQLLHGT